MQIRDELRTPRQQSPQKGEQGAERAGVYAWGRARPNPV